VIWGVEHILLLYRSSYESTGELIRSAGGYDDNIIAKESTEAEQYSEKNQS